MISAEDLIIHKCVAGRARDIEDVEGVLIRQHEHLDLHWIRSWLSESSARSHRVKRWRRVVREKSVGSCTPQSTESVGESHYSEHP